MDLVAFVRAHGPAASVYDLPRPYEANWNFLRLLRETAFLNRLGWVLTTLDKAALEAAVGPASVVQIVLGKPYGLDEVGAAVRQSLSREGQAQDGHGRDGHAGHALAEGGHPPESERLG